jgi:hypothetical protein
LEKPDSKQGNVMWKAGIDEKDQNEKARTDKERTFGNNLVSDAEAMEMELFKSQYAKEWISRPQGIKGIKIDASGRRAIKRNGGLEEKNVGFWGKPGLGKSRWAEEQAPAWHTLKKNSNKWWCGYRAETTGLLMIEDHPSITSGGNCVVRHVKLCADRYPFQGETKGSEVRIPFGRFC